MQLHPDVHCVKNKPNNGKKMSKVDVSMKFPDQDGRDDGTVDWKAELDVGLDRPGKARKTLKLKRKEFESLGALRKFKTADVVGYLTFV